jgi:hypothetical protein
VEDYENFNENIALKYRQAGVSTVTAAWASKRLVFASKQRPEKVLIIANKLDTAVEMANKIRGFTEQWPAWVGVGFSPDKNAARHFKLTNGCEVKAVATSKDALRGYTPTMLIFDEAAYIEADGDFWAACMASLSTGGKVVVVSTPNGYDPIYYEIYEQANRGMNDFKITEMFWYRDPRYTKDLYLVKTDEIIHFLLNREEYTSWTGTSPVAGDAGFFRVQARTLTGEEIAAANLLNRIAYGPTPDELEEVRRMGVEAFIEKQINAEAIAEDLDTPVPFVEEWRKVTVTGVVTASTFYVYLDGVGDVYLDGLRLVAGATDDGTKPNHKL